MTEAMLDAMVAVDNHGKVYHASLQVQALFGCNRAALEGSAWEEMFHPDDRANAADRIRGVLGGSRRVSFDARPAASAGGVETWLEVVGSPLLTAEGGPSGAVFGVRDITQRRRLQRQAEHSASHDSLTHLPNRRELLEQLGQALQKAIANGSRLSVLYIDLDRFKTVNDSLGHNIGDELLKEVASRLRAAVGPTHTLARLGGDEFACVLHGVDEAAELKLARHLHAQLGRPFQVGDHRLVIGASIGLASFPEHGRSSLDLIRAADIAMYQAKKDGIGVARYDLGSIPNSRQRLERLTALYRALERDELALMYQPLLDLSRGEIREVEGLARWWHEGRWLSAGEFVPLAEESGLIAELDRYLLKKGIQELGAWQRNHGPMRLSLNLSARSLSNPGIVPEIDRLLTQAKMPAELLTIEITETAALRDRRVTQRILAMLRDRGGRVAIDDFGSGYASLSYLRELPLDRLKIDHSFVWALGRSDRDEALVEGTLLLAHSLGLEVVAEGVETKEQRNWLERRGCDLAQGYLISRAVPLAEAVPGASPSFSETEAAAANLKALAYGHRTSLTA